MVYVDFHPVMPRSPAALACCAIFHQDLIPQGFPFLGIVERGWVRGWQLVYLDRAGLAPDICRLPLLATLFAPFFFVSLESYNLQLGRMIPATFGGFFVY